MEVNFNKDLDPIDARLATRKPRAVSPETQTTDFRQAEALNQSLQATADTRPNAVERGRQLLNDTSYPPIETIRRIAALFVSSERNVE